MVVVGGVHAAEGEPYNSLGYIFAHWDTLGVVHPYMMEVVLVKIVFFLMFWGS